MTKTQTLIIIVTIILFLLSLVFPMCYPRTSPPDESRFRRTIDAGHRGFHFLLDIPASKAIDVRALLLSWILLASLAGIAYYLARPNSEIRRLIRNRAFRRVVFWLCVSSVLVVVITVTAVAVEKLYLQPKREAKEAAAVAAERAVLAAESAVFDTEWVAHIAALRDKSFLAPSLENSDLWKARYPAEWNAGQRPRYHSELYHRRLWEGAKRAGEQAVLTLDEITVMRQNMTQTRRTNHNDLLSSLQRICSQSTSWKANEASSKLVKACLNDYSARQILAAFCKAYPADAGADIFQEYKNVKTTLALDEMGAGW